MKVIDTGQTVTIEHPEKWGFTSHEVSFNSRYPGEEHLVLGITIQLNGPYGCVPLLEIDTVESGTIISFPITLFRVTDERTSRYWQARFDSDSGLFTLWPELFYTHAFHDRLSNGEEELEKRYRELWRLMEAEHREESD